MKLTVAKELGIRESLKSIALAALPAYEGRILKTPVYFASGQDFAKMVGDTYTTQYRVSYIIMSVGRIEASNTKGCDDDPITWVTYKFQLFRQFQEYTESQSNSHDLVVADYITLYNAFNQGKDIDNNKITQYGLQMSGDALNVVESPFVRGVLGDWIDYRVRVEVNN